PAENKAIVGLAAIASCMLTTLYFWPLKLISFPTLFSEATGISSVTGKFLSASTSKILVPTRPVAPTTATFIFYTVFLRYPVGFVIKKAFRSTEGLFNFFYIRIQKSQPSVKNAFHLCMLLYGDVDNHGSQK